MLVIVVGVGIRDATGCTNDCAATVIRPPEVAAIAWNWASSQSRAAPMPRTGSVWLDSVCRVPKETSFWIVASIRLGSISRNSWRSCLSGCCARAGRPGEGASSAALAGAAANGALAATPAVTAVADRRVRRVVPPRPARRSSLIPIYEMLVASIRPVQARYPRPAPEFSHREGL